MQRHRGVRFAAALLLLSSLIGAGPPGVAGAPELLGEGGGLSEAIPGFGPRPAIDIVGDSGFNATNGVVGGNGTAGSPYVIANWTIGASSGPALSIANTRAAFEVRDCDLTTSDQTAAVFVQNVTDGSFSRLTIVDGSDRVVVSLSDRLRFTDSKLAGTDGNGIRVHDSSNVMMENLTVEGSKGTAVEIYYGKNVTLFDSSIRNVSGSAVVSLLAGSLRVDGNRIDGSGSGFWVENSEGAVVIGNTLTNVTGDAIALIGSRNGTVSRNQIDGADVGVWVATFESGRSDANTVGDNLIENVRRGIWLSQAVGAWVYFNTVRNATGHGLVVESSPGAKLHGNRVEGSRWGMSVRSLTGTRGEYPDEIRSDNTIDGKQVFYVVDAVDPVVPADPAYVGLVNVSGRISGRAVSGEGEGLMVAASTDLAIDGGAYSWNEIGVSIAGSRNLSLFGARAQDSTLVGVEVRESSEVRLQNISVANSTFSGLSLIGVRNAAVRSSSFTGNGLVGISIGESTTGVDIRGSRVESNPIGIEARASSISNSITGNAFIDNTVHAVDDGQASSWDLDRRGNFWSQFPAPDEDCDGILDTAYAIPQGSAGSSDGFPLAKPDGMAIPPCSPGRPFATVSGGVVVLDWSAPTWDGGAPIEGYRVLRGVTPSALEEIAASTSAHHEDPTVEANRTYHFAVAAVNGAGQGRLSPVTTVKVGWSPPLRADPAVHRMVAEPPRPLGGEIVRIRLHAGNAGTLAASPFSASIEIETGGIWKVLSNASAPSYALAPGQGFDMVVDRALDNGSYALRGVVRSNDAGNLMPNDIIELVLEVGASRTPADRASTQGRATAQPLPVLSAVLVVLAGLGLLAVGRRRASLSVR